MSSHEHRIKSQMKVGAGVALLGLLCPFFWLSYFSGTAGSEPWIYGLHSGAFVVLGLALLGKGWYDLRHFTG